MGRQDGLIRLKGKVGELSFYKTADGHQARTKGGTDANKFRNDPRYARARENGAEFGRAGESGKLLRTAFRPLLLLASDSRMVSRMTREMVRVIQSDATNSRGLRNVVNGNVALLTGFEFNIDGKLGQTLFAPFTPEINRVDGILSVDIPAFAPNQMIASPAGATHFRLMAGGTEVDFESKTFVTNISRSDYIAVNASAQPAIALTMNVTPASGKPLFVALGIEFSQVVNGEQYPLRNGSCNALALVAIERN